LDSQIFSPSPLSLSQFRASSGAHYFSLSPLSSYFSFISLFLLTFLFLSSFLNLRAMRSGTELWLWSPEPPRDPLEFVAIHRVRAEACTKRVSCHGAQCHRWTPRHCCSHHHARYRPRTHSWWGTGSWMSSLATPETINSSCTPRRSSRSFKRDEASSPPNPIALIWPSIHQITEGFMRIVLLAWTTSRS
jgi:hypothetical protein